QPRSNHMGLLSMCDPHFFNSGTAFDDLAYKVFERIHALTDDSAVIGMGLSVHFGVA
ncbi:MAG: hypothetical protein RLZZ335_4, partial [Bacteroidota bacterium]